MDYNIPMLIDEIQRILPHRHPFLMLDRVTELVPNERIVGIKLISANEPYFAGHFPNRPIMPGVLMLEALAQLGAIFAKLTAGGASPEGLIVFSGAKDVRFRRPVVPGDILTLTMAYQKHRGQHWWMEGRAEVDGGVACEATLMATEMS